MSIFATNFVVDEITGEVRLIKHLNKLRIDRGGWNRFSHAKGWNKSGKRNRMKDAYKKMNDKAHKGCDFIDDLRYGL